jgi:hypothetical protein
VPWLRNAVVSRVLSLDPLVDPDLVPMVVVPLGPPGLAVHVYRVARPWPRAFVACRAVVATDRDDALGRPYQPAFDPEHEVAIERAWTADRPTTCQAGRVERLAAPPDQERFRVEIQGSGYLVSRASFARGWTAWVDGSPAPVLRANGKHRAVLVPAGAHEVRLRYEPPGLWAGIVATVGAALGALAVWVSDRKEPT